jgi:hypothetical protein
LWVLDKNVTLLLAVLAYKFLSKNKKTSGKEVIKQKNCFPSLLCSSGLILPVGFGWSTAFSKESVAGWIIEPKLSPSLLITYKYTSQFKICQMKLRLNIF